TRSESGRSDESPAEALRRAMREGDLETAREAARELARAVESLDELGRETLADELRRIAGELEGEPQVPPPGRARGPEATDDTADLPEGSRADDRAANAAESSPKDPRDTVPANRPEKIDDRPEVASTPDPAQPPAGERMKGSDERPPSDGKRDPEVNPTPADPPDSALQEETEPAPRKDPSPGQAPSQVPPRPSPDTDATPRDQRPADTGESNDREKLAPRESSAKRPENQADTDPDAKRSPESTASPRERGNEPARSIGEAMRQAADDLRPAPTPGESPPPAQQPRDPGMPGGKKSPQAPRDDQPQASDSASQAASSSDRQPPEGGAPVDELKNDQREAPTSPPDANTPPSDLPTDLKGLERLAREFEKLDRQRQDARRGEAVSEELRRKAEDLLRRSTPEQRRELERLAREFARDKGPVPGGANDRERPDSNAKPSLPGSNMDDNPAASDRRFGERSTRQNDTAESPDGFEQTPMDARRPGEGLDASRPVGHIPTLLGGAPGGRGGVGITQESAREAARGVERALEQQTIPSRRSELVRRVYRRLSERATTIEPTTVTAPGRDDIQDAPDAPRRR
ncbi:MAG TPA: hypothetical protein PKU91_07405, partial [Phycisphaerales bacterium]|nr:hypothetical protein [Phycisphaerales bacterium]